MTSIIDESVMQVKRDGGPGIMAGPACPYGRPPPPDSKLARQTACRGLTFLLLLQLLLLLLLWCMHAACCKEFSLLFTLLRLFTCFVVVVHLDLLSLPCCQSFFSPIFFSSICHPILFHSFLLPQMALSRDRASTAQREDLVAVDLLQKHCDNRHCACSPLSLSLSLQCVFFCHTHMH